MRVVDESGKSSEEIVRLSSDGETQEAVARLESPKALEIPERIEGAKLENFGGRTQDPGIEALLDGVDIQANVEKSWGGEDEEGKKNAPYGWFVLIALLVGGALFMGYRTTQQGKQKVEQVKQEGDAKIEDNKLRDKEATVLVRAIEQEVKAYLAAGTIEERLAHIRQPERVRPLMEDWYRRHPLKAETYKSTGSLAGVSFRRLPFWRIQAETSDDQIHDLLLEQTSDTAAKVDWETDVYYQPMDWDRYVKERTSDKAYDFRVLTAPDTFFSHEFADDERWASFRIATADGDYLFGYARADGKITRMLHAITSMTESGVAPVILRLRTPADVKSPRGVIIESVVAPNWILMGDEVPVSDDK
ncbi:MAG: hypothetical protein JWO82_799 [Akkermansiaceae bacterium]|nr:hypothetical protein [Akkermansiaceae bacterium]